MNDHGDRIADSLRTLRTAWPNMLPEGPQSAGGSHTSGSREAPLPVPIAVLSLRREVCVTVSTLCRLVLREQVDINGNRMGRGELANDASFEVHAGWLLTWADWLGAWHSHAKAVKDLHHLAGKCEDVAKQRRTVRFPVGPCVEHGIDDTGARTACTGTLVAVLRSEDDLLPAVLRCDADPEHAWDATQWRRLGERIHNAVTAEEAAQNLLERIYGT